MTGGMYRQQLYYKKYVYQEIHFTYCKLLIVRKLAGMPINHQRLLIQMYRELLAFLSIKILLVYMTVGSLIVVLQYNGINLGILVAMMWQKTVKPLITVLNLRSFLSIVVRFHVRGVRKIKPVLVAVMKLVHQIYRMRTRQYLKVTMLRYLFQEQTSLVSQRLHRCKNWISNDLIHHRCHQHQVIYQQ